MLWGKRYSYVALMYFSFFISMIMFCFELFHPYELEVLLELFDFRAAEINNEHIEAAIL